jgi:hypothetical protein
MSAISSVGGLNHAWTNASTQRSQMQAKMLARVDTNSNGGVDQTELQALFSDISSKTGTTLDAASQFSTMDSNSDGSLTSDELAKGMQNLMPAPPSTMEFAPKQEWPPDRTTTCLPRLTATRTAAWTRPK